MVNRLLPLMVLITVSLLSFRVSATTVVYDVDNVAGNTWEYSYAVVNDTLGFTIEEFSVYFDLGLYENLVATNTPADWDPLVLQPDQSIPADGLYDALALANGIAPGATFGGFSVQFDYLGTGTPGPQFFEIVDPLTFDVLDSGTTVIPLPATLWLFGSGLFGLMGFARRKKHNN